MVPEDLSAARKNSLSFPIRNILPRGQCQPFISLQVYVSECLNVDWVFILTFSIC